MHLIVFMSHRNKKTNKHVSADSVFPFLAEFSYAGGSPPSQMPMCAPGDVIEIAVVVMSSVLRRPGVKSQCCLPASNTEPRERRVPKPLRNSASSSVTNRGVTQWRHQCLQGVPCPINIIFFPFTCLLWSSTRNVKFTVLTPILSVPFSGIKHVRIIVTFTAIHLQNPFIFSR